jgi:hypothetical protein
MKLEFNDEEMDYLFKVLAQRPWGEVSPLMVTISYQVKEQQNARPSNANGVVQPNEPSPAG